MLILVLVVLSVFSSCIAQNGGFDFRTFNDKQANFQFNGAAAGANPNSVDQLIITPNNWVTAGSIFFTNPIELTSTATFSTAFSFQMLDGDGQDGDAGVGADGIVFIINSQTNSIATIGSGLGYEGLGNSLGVEFDTWNNGPWFGDPDGNHIGIDINGNIRSVATYSPSQVFNPPSQDFVNYAWVDYSGATNTLEVRYSTSSVRPSTAVLTYNVNLIDILGVSRVFIGFSASTGGAMERHAIKSWSFNAPLSGTPVCGNFLVEDGEQCDGGGPCCQSDCTFAPSNTVCRSSSELCDAAETCSGSSSSCPTDVVSGSSVVCRAAVDSCDVAETCDGSSKACPNDVVQQNGTVCRASTGVCDAAETCNGAGVACPTDAPRKCPFVDCATVGDGYFCSADSGYTLCNNGYAYKFACAAGTGCYCGFGNECNTPCTSGCDSSPSIESMTGAQRFCQDRINLFGEHGYFCNADGAGFYQCVRDPYCTSKASIQSALHSCSTGTVCKCADTRKECTVGLTTSPCVFPEDSETRF